MTWCGFESGHIAAELMSDSRFASGICNPLAKQLECLPGPSAMPEEETPHRTWQQP